MVNVSPGKEVPLEDRTEHPLPSQDGGKRGVGSGVTVGIPGDGSP